MMVLSAGRPTNQVLLLSGFYFYAETTQRLVDSKTLVESGDESLEWYLDQDDRNGCG